MVVQVGFLSGNMKCFLDQGLIKKVSKGTCVLSNVQEDGFFNLQNRVKRGIFSLETALFLWDLTDRTSDVYTMTFLVTYNLIKAKVEGIRCVQRKVDLYGIGIGEMASPSGNIVNLYIVERTLCNLVKPRNINFFVNAVSKNNDIQQIYISINLGFWQICIQKNRI